MDAKIKADWVAALRSGKYRQGRAALRDQSNGIVSFCCLGVVCDVLGAEWQEDDDQAELNGEYVRCGVSSFLNDYALCLLDLTNEQQRTLAHMNDDSAPFPIIADYIEANL